MATIKEIVIARLSEFSVSLATNTIDSYITASGIDGSQTFTLERLERLIFWLLIH